MARTTAKTNQTTVHRVDESLQKERYGGFSFLSAFFGWLVSTGISSILIGILAAGGSAVAVAKLKSTASVSDSSLSTVGIASGLLLVLVLAIAYFAGGYVAGRMSRFDGGRQGFGVWVMGVVMVLLLALLGAILGAKYNVLQQLSMPHIPIDEGSLTVGGLITTIFTIAVSLGAAILGGKVGERYHHRVDETGVVGRR